MKCIDTHTPHARNHFNGMNPWLNAWNSRKWKIKGDVTLHSEIPDKFLIKSFCEKLNEFFFLWLLLANTHFAICQKMHTQHKYFESIAIHTETFLYVAVDMRAKFNLMLNIIVRYCCCDFRAKPYVLRLRIVSFVRLKHPKKIDVQNFHWIKAHTAFDRYRPLKTSPHST